MVTVAVGLSGGVDSTITALLLKEQGYDVVGLTMRIYNGDIPNLKEAGNACYGPEEKEDIPKIQEWCAQNNIPCRILDCAQEYKQIVLSYFKQAYLSGQTPNPCIRCNLEMKFGLMLEKALSEGITFDYFATGHYVRIGHNEKTGRFFLRKGVDLKKDQSYFLYRLRQEQLAKTIFPLGTYTKEQVRALAKARHLAVADKADSQDFYAGDYTDLLQQPPRPGKIIHTNGHVLGTHQGFWHYTIGQRKGLGIAYKEPLYVVDIDTEQNAVIVGTAEQTQKEACLATDVVWSALEKLEQGITAEVKYRSSGRLVPAFLEPQGDTILVRFKEPQRSVTRGQSIVFYQDDLVLGGGIIQDVPASA